MLRHVKGHEVAMQPEKQYLPEDLLDKLVAEGSVPYLGLGASHVINLWSNFRSN